MPDEPRRCEYRDPGAIRPECRSRAIYRVSRPTRKRDARNSCRRHLAATVDALSQGDSSLMLNVTYIREGNRG